MDLMFSGKVYYHLVVSPLVISIFGLIPSKAIGLPTIGLINIPNHLTTPLPHSSAIKEESVEPSDVLELPSLQAHLKKCPSKINS